MRGCLFVLLLGLAVLVGGFWFGAPILATTLVRASLESAGLPPAPASEVELEIASPLDLLSGRVDGVDVATRFGRLAGLSWMDGRIELGGVNLFDRTVDTVRIDLETVHVRGDTDRTILTVESLVGSGPAVAVETTLTITPEDFLAGFRIPLASRFAIGGPGLTFRAPNLLVRDDPTLPFTAELRIEAGELIADPDRDDLSTVELYRPRPDVPVVLTDAQVVDGNLVIKAVVDLAEWLGG